MNRTRIQLATIAAGTAIGCISGNAAADACYADTQLDVANSYVTTTHVYGNGGTASTLPRTSTGNPGQFLQVDTAVNSAAAGQGAGVTETFIFSTAIYDPQTQGAIYRICYEEWAYRINGSGQVQGTGPVLRQVDAAGNLAYYRAVPSLAVGAQTSWNRKADTYVEADFVAIDPTDVLDGLDQSRNPDFSSQGQLIEFGFYRSNSTTIGGPGFSRSAAIDSWSLTVISECEGDANRDGTVGFQDILFVLANWNRVCPP